MEKGGLGVLQEVRVDEEGLVHGGNAEEEFVLVGKGRVEG